MSSSLRATPISTIPVLQVRYWDEYGGQVVPDEKTPYVRGAPLPTVAEDEAPPPLILIGGNEIPPEEEEPEFVFKKSTLTLDEVGACAIALHTRDRSDSVNGVVAVYKGPCEVDLYRRGRGGESLQYRVKLPETFQVMLHRKQ